MKEAPEKQGFGLLNGLFVLAVLAVLAVMIMHLQTKIKSAQEQEREIAQQVDSQKQQNAALEAGLEKADDPEYLQELAREQLGMVSPGEKVFHDVSN